MNSIGLAVATIIGTAAGLLVLSLYPAGLNSSYGLTLLLLGIATVVPALLARGDRRAIWSSLLAAFFLLAVGRAVLIHPPVTPSDLAYYNGPASAPDVKVVGTIATEPVLSDRSQSVRIAATDLSAPAGTASYPVRGAMYAVLPRYPEYTIGETLSLSGKLTVPPSFSGFDYAAYLAHEGVFSYMLFPKVVSLGNQQSTGIAAYVVAQRLAARHTLESVVAEPEASIAVGVVTGDRASMSDQTKAAFQLSGTTHILAISGENIAILVGFVWLFYGGGPVKRRLPLWLALAVILLVVVYTIFTGASPSVVRAAIMAAVLLLGPLVGRRYDPVAALAVSAAIMVLFDPNLLVDSGFLLSFGAMFGIAVLSPLFNLLLHTLHFPNLVAAPLAVSLGATFGSLPIGAFFFGLIPPVGPLATLTADFALPPLMVAGILTVILGAIPGLAAITGWLVWLFGGWLLLSAQFWSSLPFASLDVSGVTLPQVVIYYAVLLLAIFFLSNPRHRARLRLRSGMGTAILGVMAVAAWAVALFIILP